VAGIAGCPFLVFHGEVSEDSDGPMELCRPVAPISDADPATAMANAQLRAEPAHDEVFIRLALKDMGWPALAPAVDALEVWIREQGREPAGALRQVLIADQRTASPDTPVCDSASRYADDASVRPGGVVPGERGEVWLDPASLCRWGGQR
jgi:hypothetical protein